VFELGQFEVEQAIQGIPGHYCAQQRQQHVFIHTAQRQDANGDAEEGRECQRPDGAQVEGAAIAYQQQQLQGAGEQGHQRRSGDHRQQAGQEGHRYQARAKPGQALGKYGQQEDQENQERGHGVCVWAGWRRDSRMIIP